MLRFQLRDFSVVVMVRCFATFILLTSLPSLRSIFSFVSRVPFSTQPVYFLQFLFGGQEQFLALAPLLVLQARVEASHEPFAWIAGGGDLVDLVGDERLGAKRRLLFDFLPGLGLFLGYLEQRPDLVFLQGCDPVQPEWGQIVPNAFGGDHAPVADHGNAVDAETVAHASGQGGKGARVSGIAGKDLNWRRGSHPVRRPERN